MKFIKAQFCLKWTLGPLWPKPCLNIPSLLFFLYMGNRSSALADYEYYKETFLSCYMNESAFVIIRGSQLFSGTEHIVFISVCITYSTVLEF